MGIVAVNKEQIREQQKQAKVQTLSGVGFSDFMNVAGATGTEVVAQKVGYQPAALAAAAVSGIAAAPGSMGANAPYYSSGASTVGVNSPFSGGGYNYNGSQFNAGIGYSGPGGSGGIGVGLPGGVSPAGYSPVGYGAPSQDYQEKQALFQQMNDANWEMLLAQVTVNEISRDYQARSNILKTKSDTELNAVRNMRA